MTTKQFKGKAIYNPSGKAGEYSYWACNFYNGCSNNCDYCYCKRGVMASTWNEKPYLKKCFRDEEHALEIFEKEMMQNLSELQKHGLFFSFTTDPMLLETKMLTVNALIKCIERKIPCKILTKQTDWVEYYEQWFIGCKNCHFLYSEWKKYLAIGFTLTGHDELEPSASFNEERIEAMKRLHEAGFRTWASIEPIIDFDSSLQMLFEIRNCCDLVKIGLESGRRYPKGRLLEFIEKSLFWANGNRLCADKLQFIGFKVYFKDGLLQQAGISRDQLPANCVGRDYNIFK